MTPDDLSRLERRLAGWTPSPAASGRDRILFEAGIAAGRRQARSRMAAVLVALAIGSGGWTIHGQIIRDRLERALAAKSQALERALAEHRPASKLDLSPPIAPEPTSDLALGRLGVSGIELPGRIGSPSPRNQFPPNLGPVLTPISIRRPEDLADL